MSSTISSWSFSPSTARVGGASAFYALIVERTAHPVVVDYIESVSPSEPVDDAQARLGYGTGRIVHVSGARRAGSR